MEAFVQLIRDAAAQLGIAATQVWPHVVMTTFYQSLVTLVLVGIVFVTAAVLLTLGWRSVSIQNAAMKRTGYVYEQADSNVEAMGWLTFGFIAMIVFCILLLPHAVSGVFEPEGQTVRDLIGK